MERERERRERIHRGGESNKNREFPSEETESVPERKKVLIFYCLSFLSLSFSRFFSLTFEREGETERERERDRKKR